MMTDPIRLTWLLPDGPHILTPSQPSTWQGWLPDPKTGERKLVERESVMTCGVLRKATAEEIERWREQA